MTQNVFFFIFDLLMLLISSAVVFFSFLEAKFSISICLAVHVKLSLVHATHITCTICSLTFVHVLPTNACSGCIYNMLYPIEEI
jgi:hypothetical protein